MNLKIRDKLFIVFLLGNFALLAVMVLLIQWSFGRGFLSYVNEVEEQTCRRLDRRLEQAYDRQGSWDFLRGDFPRWHELVGRVIPIEPHSHPPRPDPDGEGTVQGPPQSPLGIVTRLSLLDETGQFVVGNRRLARVGPDRPGIQDRPLHRDGQVVGYLRLASLRTLDDTLDLRFVHNQTRTFYLIAFALLVLGALASLWVARQLVAPVRVLARGTHRLTAGRYDTRLPVTTRDELGGLAADFNVLAATLERNEKARRRWIADISHELRTPLTILRGELQAVEDGVRPLNEETRQSLSAEVERLGSLVEDLYQLSLSDSGALNYRKEPLDLGEAVEEAVEAFQGRFEAGNLTLELRPAPPDTLPVFGDHRRLHQLLGNILENTLRYTDPGGRVRLAWHRTGDRAVVELNDSSPGVPPEAVDKLFERFYRVEASRSRARGGAGLGLAICKNIVEAHGGNIKAAPSPLGGLSIRIELPLYQPGETP